MKKIPSFTIDHNKLSRGVYISRIDVTVSGDVITTFDIRLTNPNREKAVTPEALHTIEHLAATWLRNNPDWSNRVVYWGPMGCCTGCYLILQGKLFPSDIEPLLKELFKWMSNFEGEIPGATPRDCGNYKFNDLSEAKKVAQRFYEEVLLHLNKTNTEYPH